MRSDLGRLVRRKAGQALGKARSQETLCESIRASTAVVDVGVRIQEKKKETLSNKYQSSTVGPSLNASRLHWT